MESILGVDEVERWVSVGEAASIASRDKTTIRRWADTGLVVARRSATGHRQILLSALRAVLATGGPRVLADTDPTAGRVMFERWVVEAKVLARWSPSGGTPVATLETWRRALQEVDDTLAYLARELDAAIAAADEQW